MLPAVEGSDYLVGHLSRTKHHGVTEVAAEEGGVDKARTDVGKADVEATTMRLLLQGLQIDILHRLCGRIGRSGAQSLCACYRGDGSDMAVTLFCKITIRLTDHPCKTETVRLNRCLANSGICSRREADSFIEAGVVTVNGEVVTELGTKVLRTDDVRFHDQPVTLEKKVYVLLNKPKDYVTTSDDPQQRRTVMDLVKGACPERIYPVGRLDRNTTGVLLLTNDGDLASKLTHPKYLKKKIYHVHLDKAVTAHDMQQIAEGLNLEDGEIKADEVQYVDPADKKQVGIEIHSGRNRIVRRIFESLGYRVLKLDRVLFAGLTKKNLRRGYWRYLTEEEVDRLRMGAYE